MSTIQLSFSLRTTSNVKTVHLIGSWDSYQGQLPLSRDGHKSGSWKGTFRFQPTVLQAGQRYWFYYMMDGYQVCHDPSKDHTVEPTTGRKLNILDVPKNKSSSSSSSRRSSRRHSREVPHGRAISPSAIACPKPQRPGITSKIIEQAHNQSKMDQLAWRLAAASLEESSDDECESDSDSDEASDLPSLSSSRGSGSSSPSSVSSVSSSCSCERYGITRDGDRVRLDCGGARCGYSDEDGCEESSEDEEDSEAEQYKHRVREVAPPKSSKYTSSRKSSSRSHHSSRRHGMVVV